ncbi:zinc finger, CCHC-type containing protein [Tanacetum coccineum]
MVNAMLISSGLSQDMWGEAILTATYLLNKIPHQPEEEEVDLRRSKRARTEKSFGPDFVSFMVENEPTSYREANMLIIGSNDKMIKSTKDVLKSKFDMKDMGLADVILGIKIIQTQNGLVLSQAHYVDKTLNNHNARDSGLARTPIDTIMHLSKNRGVGVAQLEYSRIIGMLMYLMTSTRPDLEYVVSRLSRYTSNPSDAHLKAINKIYSDVNWISDIKDSRSTSGYLFTLGGETISWKSSKKTVIAESTIHIRRRHNLIRKLLSAGDISIDYVKSKDNIADPLTKGLSRELVSRSSKGTRLKLLKE